MPGLVSTILTILATSVLSSVFTFLSLRWLFGKIAEGLSGLTHLGAKVAGEASGMLGAKKAVRNEIASGILKSPNLAGVRLIASQVGFDIDGMIEEHGAEETLAGAIQIMEMLGMNPQKMLMDGIGSIGKGLLGKSSTVNRGELP